MSVRSPAVSVSRAAVSVSVRRGSFRCVRQAAGRSGRSGFRQRQRSRHRQRSYPWRGCACSIGPARGSLRSCSCDPAPVWRAQRVVCRVGLVEHVRHNPQGRRVAGRLDCETLLRSAFGTPTSCAGCVVCTAGWRGECGGREAQSGRRYRYRLPCPALRQCASVAQWPARSGSDAARRAQGWRRRRGTRWRRRGGLVTAMTSTQIRCPRAPHSASSALLVQSWPRQLPAWRQALPLACPAGGWLQLAFVFLAP